MKGFLCMARIYEYKGRRFEYPAGYGPPWPLKKDGDPYKRAGAKWWDFIQPFLDLPDEEQAKYRIGGGCIPFGEETERGMR